MKIKFHKNFKKQYKKLRALQTKVNERLILFEKNPFDRVLNNHALKGKYEGYKSINITGNFRALYKIVKDDTIVFIDLDTHSNLYK